MAGYQFPEQRKPWFLVAERGPSGWRVCQGRREVAVFERLEDAQTSVAAVNMMRGLPSHEPLN